MGADFYERPDQLAADHHQGWPPIGIGSGATIENAIVDKNCHVGANVRIIGDPQQVERIAAGCCEMLDGILVVPKNSVLPDGWQRS
jgi:glucose-1-phosphate adenylyltransferase